MTPRARLLLLDAMHAWHRIAGSREMTVAAMAKPLHLSPVARVRLGHQLRQAHGMTIGGFKVLRAGMVGGLRRWRIVKVTTGEAGGAVK
jgi:hypothetical protein